MSKLEQNPEKTVDTKNGHCDKMIIAVLQNDDFHEVIRDLNEHGFYVTILNSSGGFLKKPSATIMIGVNHEYLEEAVGILKCYGRRTEMQYGSVPISPFPVASMPVQTQCGGVVLFVTDVERYERF